MSDSSREPGWERATLEKLAFSALQEQRSARRWKIFFRLAWLVLQAVYRARARYPADTHKAALSRVLFGTNMTDARAAELEELYGLVSRRLAAVAVRTLAPGSTA